MRVRALTLASVLLLSAAACGGSSNPESTPTTPGTTAASVSPTPCATVAPGPVELCGVVNNAGQADVTGQGADVELRVTTPGFRFDPTFIKVTPGAEVTITLVNLSEAAQIGSTHSLTIDALQVGEVVKAEETKTFTVTLPTEGESVPFYCAIGGSQGHIAAGMQGAFYFG
jgi:plastocyanin